MRLVTTLTTCGLAVAVALVGLAGSASAQTVCTPDITAATPLGPTPGCDRIWGDEPDEAFIVIDSIVFVIDTDLTILDGTIIRGNPRNAAFAPATPLVGAPGTLIVPRGSFVNGRGTAGSPIIFTTAAVDNNDDGIPDDDDLNGFPDDWAPGDKFLDDTPLSNPLAPLRPDGEQQYNLHGGLVLLGYAPTNLDASATGIVGEGICEGLPVPGVLPSGATYGGLEPHDSTGIIEYWSIRHAGDEIAPANELNGITLCGVGDGTVINHVEGYANGDDGFEMFGGTVNLRNVQAAYIGDDSIDVDQGFTGTLQDVFTLSVFFNEDDGGDVGTGGSGDAAGEFDGQDCAACTSPLLPWPDMVASNWTHVGNVEAGMNGGITNPAVSPNSDNEGIQADTEWCGIIANSMILGMSGGGQPNIEFAGAGNGGPAADECYFIVSSTGDHTLDADATTAAANGDAQVAAGTEYVGGNANSFSFGGQILVNENHYFDPKGVISAGRSKLLGSKTTDAGALGGAPMDPRPDSPAAAYASGGVEPHWPGMDPSETFKGAFEASGDLWSEPWSALSAGGIID